MNPDTLAILILNAVALCFICGIIAMVVKRRSIGNFASLTIYHDFQPKDKQEAVEIVMEKKAGKKLEDQESGKGSDRDPLAQNYEPRTKHYEHIHEL